MGFLVPTLILVFAFIVVVRAGAIALMTTGMDSSKSSFQALSAFSGTGFTTREAELIVSHPRRRRIVSWLMVLGIERGYHWVPNHPPDEVLKQGDRLVIYGRVDTIRRAVQSAGEGEQAS